MNDTVIELDERPKDCALATMETLLKSKLPSKMIITSANLRLGELIGQGNNYFVDYLSTCIQGKIKFSLNLNSILCYTK